MAGIPAASAGKAARAGDPRFPSCLRPGEQTVKIVPGRRAAQEAGLLRRLGATIYEALLLAAVLIAVGFALLPFVTPAAAPPSGVSPSLYRLSPTGRALMAIATVGASAAYCAAFWSRGRRTLAMKTWRLAIVTDSGTPAGPARALLRFAACQIGPALAIAGFALLEPIGRARWALALVATNYVWALVDPGRRFLQDRVARTRLVRESR